jgi:hypothetical protein
MSPSEMPISQHCSQISISCILSPSPSYMYILSPDNINHNLKDFRRIMTIFVQLMNVFEKGKAVIINHDKTSKLKSDISVWLNENQNKCEQKRIF